MMKKLFYTFCILAVPVIIGLLLYQRTGSQKSVQMPRNAQTIIPAASSVPEEEKGGTEYSDKNIQPVVTLLSDEMPIDELQTDISGDNKEDKIVAVKKYADQFVYLVLFLQDAEAQTFARAAEIKTKVTQEKTLIFYTLHVQEYTCPIIAYSGINEDNEQAFGMDTIEIDKNQSVHTVSLADIQADGQIVLKNNKVNSISGYTIHAYYADDDMPDTLNQTEKRYTWSEKKHIFEQTKEIKIPGKKIESQFLQTFQAGNADSFHAFLEGLWYQPAAKKDENRKIFFNHTENEIIFSGNNIQEMFTVDSASPRRFNVYFSTKNAAIPSIHRRVAVELTGIDEISVRVIDDIARLKIGVSSNWDGTYRKINNNIREAQKPSFVAHTQKSVMADGKTWKSADGYSLRFTETAYQLSQDGAQESGWYTMLQIKEKVILQLKDREKHDRFFYVIFDDADKKLILTEVSVTLNGTVSTGSSPLVFE